MRRRGLRGLFRFAEVRSGRSPSDLQLVLLLKRFVTGVRLGRPALRAAERFCPARLRASAGYFVEVGF